MLRLGYTFIMKDEKDNYKLYMEAADEMLEIADENFGNKHYRAACNRAYYGIFYAAARFYFPKERLMESTARLLQLFASILSRQVSSTNSGAIFIE